TNNAEAVFTGCAGPDELIGKTDFDFYPPELATQFHADERRIVQSGVPMVDHLEPRRSSSGAVTWIQTTKVPLRDNAGKVVGIVGASRDITAQKRSEDEINSFFTLSLDMLCIADFNGFFKRISPVWERTVG